MEYFIQIIGLMALFFGLCSVFTINDKNLKLYRVVSAFLFSIHYAIMGSFSEAGIKFVGAIRNYFSLKTSSKSIMMVFLAFYYVVGIYFYKEPIDVLLILAPTFGTISLFMFSGIWLRIVSFPSSAIWLFIAIHNRSFGGIIFETVIIIISLTTIYRLHVKKK